MLAFASKALLLIVLVSFLQDVSGLDCDWTGSQAYYPFNPKSCPRPSDEITEVSCCTNDITGFGYCCDEDNTVGPTDVLLFGVVLTTSILAITLFCCCCCPCCCVYKRRNGQVYGRAPAPGYTTVVTTQQAAPVVYGTQQLPYPVQPMAQPLMQPMMQPMMQPPPGYPPQQYAPYPVMPAALPPTYGEATSEEMYRKQAAYNPTY